MTYTVEFKQRVFRVLQFTPFVVDAMSALEANLATKLRYVLEDAMDDDDLFEKDKANDDGDRIVLNAKLHAYNSRKELYSEFMEQLTIELDGAKVYA